jgi:hypothetical protein
MRGYPDFIRKLLELNGKLDLGSMFNRILRRNENGFIS